MITVNLLTCNQKEFGRALGITEDRVSKLLNGPHSPRRSTLETLGQKVGLGWLEFAQLIENRKKYTRQLQEVETRGIVSSVARSNNQDSQEI